MHLSVKGKQEKMKQWVESWERIEIAAQVVKSVAR